MYHESEPIGCEMLRLLDSQTNELKLMYVKREFRGRGYALKLLAFLEASVQTSGYRVIRLETGTRQPEANGLYESSGYHPIPAYGELGGNPFSVCYEKEL